MSKPNILYILADQWRGDCLGVNGHPVVETPNLDIAGVPTPGAAEGISLLPTLGEARTEKWRADADRLSLREFIHGEHSATYDPQNAMQFLTDGKEKYIWFPVTGDEQLFDLSIDPDEINDNSAIKTDRLDIWRGRLIEQFADRPLDGLSDGNALISGKSPPPARSDLTS